MDIHALFGIAAGILEAVSLPLYVGSILSGKTKPDRVTWWILALVSSMIAASYFASGARDTLWLPIVYAVCMLVVAFLSLKFGEGKPRLSGIDRLSLTGALASAIFWWLVHSPVTALFLNILTEFIGLFPTMLKARRRPWTESTLPWAIGTLAALLNLFAITQWSFAIALYPLYIFATNLIITAFLLRKKKLKF